jgi:hypothetical protein
MTSLHRFILVTFVAAAAFGCGKKPTEEAHPDKTAAPAPPPPPEKKAEKPKAEHEHEHKGEEKKEEKKAAVEEAGFHWEVHKPTNIKFELPKEWTTSIEGNVLVAKTPTPGVGIEFVGVDGKLSAKYDEKLLLKEVTRSLTKVKVTEHKGIEQHGLKGNMVVGTGFRDGADVHWRCRVLGDGKGHDMLTLAFYQAHLEGKYKDELIKILDSVQPAG